MALFRWRRLALFSAGRGEGKGGVGRARLTMTRKQFGFDLDGGSAAGFAFGACFIRAADPGPNLRRPGARLSPDISAPTVLHQKKGRARSSAKSNREV